MDNCFILLFSLRACVTKTSSLVTPCFLSIIPDCEFNILANSAVINRGLITLEFRVGDLY